MIEEIDTKSNFADKEIPDGVDIFRVVGCRKNEAMYIWSFTYENGSKEGEMVFFANNMGGLLKVLGCKETSKGVYAFDTSLTDGVQFKATVYSEPDKKDKSIMRKRMKDFDEVPF